MNTKHTPGPWHAADIRLRGHNPKMDGCDIGAANGANVALAFHQPHDREIQETIANARLIAAAPELLEALKSALAVGQIVGGSKDVARAAIAKAEVSA